MREVRTGVWHWQAPHPDWRPAADWGQVHGAPEDRAAVERALG